MSPLRFPPLYDLGLWVTQRVHGRRRSSQGYLLTAKHYLTSDDEWRLGQSYLGALGLPLYGLIMFYVAAVHPDVGYEDEGGWNLGPVDDWPVDMKVLVPIAVVALIVSLLSLTRLFMVWRALGAGQICTNSCISARAAPNVISACPRDRRGLHPTSF